MNSTLKQRRQNQLQTNKYIEEHSDPQTNEHRDSGKDAKRRQLIKITALTIHLIVKMRKQGRCLSQIGLLVIMISLIILNLQEWPLKSCKT